jgi:hypothetical protein
MITRLTTVSFIILFTLLGLYLILLPWTRIGPIGEWADNYFLNVISDSLNFPALRSVVSSGWARGAVTGLGIVNLLAALREVANFHRSVQFREGQDASSAKARG